MAPQFGFIYKHMCKSFPVSGTACYLECRHGFLSNGGVNLIHCGKDGKWDKDVSSVLKCLGKPFFSYLFRLKKRKLLLLRLHCT